MALELMYALLHLGIIVLKSCLNYPMTSAANLDRHAYMKKDEPP